MAGSQNANASTLVDWLTLRPLEASGFCRSIVSRQIWKEPWALLASLGCEAPPESFPGWPQGALGQWERKESMAFPWPWD